MRNFIGSAMATTMALSVCSAVILFGGVTNVLVTPALLLGFSAALMWAGKLLTARKVSWKQAPTNWPVLAFLLYAVIRYFTSPLEYNSRQELILVLFYALVYFVAANNFYHARDRIGLIVITAFLTVVEAGYGIWQAATASDMVFLFQRPPSYSGRGSGSYVCPNHLAGFLEMTLGLLAARAAFFHGKRGVSEKNVIHKVLLVYAALMALAGILSTFSRAGWLATAAAMLALLLWTEGRLRAAWQRIALGGVALSAVLLAIFMLPKVWGMVDRVFLPGQTGGGRTLMWNATVRIIQDAPLFGTGPGTWEWFHQAHRHPSLQIHPLYAHSDPLHLLADYGLVGWAIAIAFFACFFWHVALLTTRKTPSDQRSFAIGGSLVVIALLAHSWADFNFHIPANALFLVLVIGFVASLDDPRDRYRRVQMGTGLKSALGVLVLLLSIAGLWATGQSAWSSWLTGKGIEAKEMIDWDTAIGRFEAAIAADGGNPNAYAMLGDVYRTQALWRLGDANAQERRELAERAVAFYRASLERNPYQTQILARLANAYELLQEPEKSLQALETALSVDPNSAFVYQRLGLHYRNQGDEEKAAQAFRHSEELNAEGDEISRLNLEEIRPRQ